MLLAQVCWYIVLGIVGLAALIGAAVKTIGNQTPRIITETSTPTATATPIIGSIEIYVN